MKLILTILICFIGNSIIAQKNYILLKSRNADKVCKIKEGRKIIFSLEGQTEILKGRLTKINLHSFLVQIKRGKIKKTMDLLPESLVFIGILSTLNLFGVYLSKSFKTNRKENLNNNKQTNNRYKKFYLNQWEIIINSY